jgi:glycine/D-amino acid oxidase-like deaminating enzyme
MLCVVLPFVMQDLEQHPRNGWSQLGLLQVAKAAGRTAEQQAAQQQWQTAWADAEVHVSSSCPALAEPFPG